MIDDEATAIMKAFQVTTCSYPCSNNSQACQSSASTDWDSTPISKAGPCMPSNSAKRLAFIRTRFRTTDDYPPSFFVPYGWLSTQAFIPRDGHAIRSWSFPQVRSYRRADDPNRNRPLYLLARAGSQLQAWPAQVSRTPHTGSKRVRPGSTSALSTDEMLNGGTLPLDLLEARTDKWIAQQKAK